MMLDHLGEPEAGQCIIQAIESVLMSENAPLTPDLGGKASTAELGGSIAEAITRLRQ
jgi:tartrate dehydrogenase/decarboxylase/D-malate dehydrogenase